MTCMAFMAQDLSGEDGPCVEKTRHLTDDFPEAPVGSMNRFRYQKTMFS